MKRRTVSILLLGLVTGCLIGSRQLTLHDFHVSVTQMQYNSNGRTFEISLRVFTDDLERALSAEAKTGVRLGPDNKHERLLENYVRSHFAYVNPQKQAKPFTYVGHEIEADAHWLYLEMPYAEPFRGGVMKQNMLMELFDDQVNMVNLQYQGQKKTVVFRKNQPVQDVSL